MIPFPGESLPILSATNVSGVPVATVGDIRVRGGVSTFHSGDAARLVAVFSTHYLEGDTEPGEVSWCVEVSGGGGSLTLTECLGDGTPDVPLGTFTVAGGDTLVVPSTAITLADVWNTSYGTLLLACDTGTVDVQQVKLRAFPVGGPLGDWGADLHPSWELHDYAELQGAGRRDRDGEVNSWGGPYPTDYHTGWANTLATMPQGLSGDAPTPILIGLGSASDVSGGTDVYLYGESYTLPSPGSSGGNSIIDGAGVVATRVPHTPDVNPAEGLVDGVDYIVSPYEVHGDDRASATADTDPTLTWDETYDVAGVTYSLGELITTDDYPGNDAPPVFPLLGAIPWEPTEELVGGAMNIWPDAAAGPPIDLTLPDVDAVLIAPSHGWFRESNPAVPNNITSDYIWTGTYQNGFNWRLTVPLTYTVHMPPYRVWSVNAVTESPLRLMQRGDGLGMGSGRLLGAGTRQASTRLFGSL